MVHADSSVLVVHLFINFALDVGVLTDRDLDALVCKFLAQWRTFTHAGELLGRVHVETLAVARRQDWRSALVYVGSLPSGASNVDEGEP